MSYKHQLIPCDIVREVKTSTGSKPKQVAGLNASSSCTLEVTSEHKRNKVMNLHKVTSMQTYDVERLPEALQAAGGATVQLL